MIDRRGAALAFAGLLLLAATGAATAAEQATAEDPEDAALRAAKVTLSQAIATAEQETGGKSYDAGVDVEHGEPRFVVETTGPKGVQTVIVDAQSGQIIGGHAGGELN